MNRLQKEFLDKIYYNFTHNSKRYNESYKSEHWKYQNKRKLNPKFDILNIVYIMVSQQAEIRSILQ